MKAIIEVEKFGTMAFDLMDDLAPISVKNFAKLAKEGFYNGLTFHRIIEGFMIQGGCPKGNGTGGPGYCIKGEFSANGVNNPIKHERGVISMARAMDFDSAGNQFFIMHRTVPQLDGQYAAFGKIVSGIEIVDAIASVRTDFRDAPLERVVIKKITIEE